MAMTFWLIETISVLLAVDWKLLAAVPQGLTRTRSLGPMVWPGAALIVVPFGTSRRLLVPPAAPVEENNQPPGPSAGCVPLVPLVVTKVYCGLGVLFTCSNVAHNISG